MYPLSQVDCDVYKEMCSDYRVRGYPTLKWFPAGTDIPVEAGLMAEAEALAVPTTVKGHAERYLKVMRSVVEKGDEYVKKEIARLSKVLDDGVGTVPTIV
ncbi:unnamed protein product [Closterium sp. NIES-53]